VSMSGCRFVLAFAPEFAPEFGETPWLWPPELGVWWAGVAAMKKKDAVSAVSRFIFMFHSACESLASV
jgi:hypothetical protein